LLEETHIHYLTLWGGQCIHHLLDVDKNLLVDDFCLTIGIEYRCTTQVAQVVVNRRLYDVLVFLGAIPVHDYIVGYARNPELELAAVGILPHL